MTDSSDAIRPENLHQNVEWLRRVARRILLDDDRANDIVQESILAALRHSGGVQAVTRGWLAGTVRNLARKVIRTESTRARAMDTLRNELKPAERAALASGEVVARTEMTRRLIGAVAELKEPYRTAVLFRFYQDEGPQEIAERLGVPVETVRTRVRRGLQLLRDRLDSSFGGDRAACAFALLGLALEGTGPTAAGAGTGVLGPVLASGPMRALLLAGLPIALGAIALVIIFGGGEEPAPAKQPVEVAQQPQLIPDEPSEKAGGEDARPTPPRRAAQSAEEKLPPTRAVSGTVKDAAGNVVAGAKVAVVRRIPGAVIAFETLAESDTDENGEYSVGPFQGRVLVEVFAEGLSRSRRHAFPGCRRDFVLRVGGSVTGKVVHVKTGEPHADALVALYLPNLNNPFDTRGRWRLLEWIPDATGTSRADGTYRIDDLPPGDYRFVLLPKDASPVNPAGLEHIEVRSGVVAKRDHCVGDGVRLLGKVIDAQSGEPIAGALIHMENIRQQAQSGPNGEFVIKGIVPNRETTVRTSRKGYIPCVFPIFLAHAGDLEQEIPLVRSGWVVGSVADRDGRPIEGAQLELDTPDAALRRESAVRTGPDGMFSMSIPTATETVRIIASARGHANRVSAPVRNRPGQKAELGRLRLGPGGTLIGRVAGNQGQPVADAVISIRDDSGHTHWAGTDSEGQYRCERLPPGQYQVEAWPFSASEDLTADHSRAKGLRAGVAEGAEVEANIGLPHGATLAGRVVFPGGAPVENARLLAAPGNDVIKPMNGGGVRADLRRTSTDKNGRFYITGLRRDGIPYALLVAPGGPDWFGFRIIKGLEADRTDLVVTVRPLARAKGRVVLEGGGRPATDFWVLAQRIGQAAASNQAPSTRYQVVNAGGHFELVVQPGPYLITAGTADGLVSMPVRIDLATDSRLPVSDLVLRQGGAVSGTVQSPEGESLADCVVCASLVSGSSTNRVARTTSDSMGRFRFEVLPYGTYLLEVVHPFHIDWAASVHLELARGVSATIPLSIQRCGRLEAEIVDGIGKGVNGAAVTVFDRQGTHLPNNVEGEWVYYKSVRGRDSQSSHDWAAFRRGFSLTGRSGRLHPRFLAPGEYVVEVQAAGYARQRKRVQIKSLETTSLTIAVRRK